MKNIYFTDNFIDIIGDSSKSINLSQYKLGKLNEGNSIKNPSEITFRYMEEVDIISPTSGYYNFESIYDNGILRINIQVPSTDESINEGDDSDSQYKILYIMYTDILVDKTEIAFILYDRIQDENRLNLNPLMISRDNNLINIEIPIKCKLLTYQNTNTSHLEDSGVRSMNFYSLNNRISNYYYIDKNSYFNYYYNKISSNDPYYGGVTINKFGLKTY